MHDEADSIRLDPVASKEFAHVCGRGLERNALHLEDALTAKAQRKRGLHLFAGHLRADGKKQPQSLVGLVVR